MKVNPSRKLSVYIVKPSETHEEWQTKLLNEASQLLRSLKVKLTWIDGNTLDDFNTDRDSTIFVLEPFNGPLFKKLKDSYARVISPIALITSLNINKTIPKIPFPVHSTAMENLVICTTGLRQNRRDELFNKVYMMCGTVSRDFISSVTHLICEDIGSAKYQMAFRLKRPVMQAKWVEDVWLKSAKEHVAAGDDVFRSCTCLVFKSCEISVTGFRASERRILRNLIEKEGGIYHGDFTPTCTHLVCKEPAGEKFRLASSHKSVIVLKSAWIYDCVKSGYHLPTDLYLFFDLKKLRKTSTPSKPPPKFDPHCSTIPCESAIAADLNSQDSRGFGSFCAPASIDDRSSFTGTGSVTLGSGECIIDKETTESLTSNCKMFLHKANSALFVDCTFNLDTIAEPLMSFMKQAIVAGGGQMEASINCRVTHIITGRLEHAVLEYAAELYGRVKVHIVRPEWFDQCLISNALIDPTTFVSKDQWLSDNRLSALRGTWEDEERAESLIVITDMIKIFEPVFSGKSVRIVGFHATNKENLINVVNACKGTLDWVSVRTDLTIVPLIVPPGSANNGATLITDGWLRACLDKRKLIHFSISEFLEPIPFSAWGCKPLLNTVITLSGFPGIDRDALTYICKRLGAITLDNLVKQNASMGVGSSHLVCKEPSGSKYKAAKKWNLHVVGVSWIIETLLKGAKADEADHDIETCGPFTADFIKFLKDERIKYGFDRFANAHSVSSRLHSSVLSKAHSVAGSNIMGAFDSSMSNQFLTTAQSHKSNFTPGGSARILKNESTVNEGCKKVLDSENLEKKSLNRSRTLGNDTTCIQADSQIAKLRSCVSNVQLNILAEETNFALDETETCLKQVSVINMQSEAEICEKQPMPIHSSHHENETTVQEKHTIIDKPKHNVFDQLNDLTSQTRSSINENGRNSKQSMSSFDKLKPDVSSEWSELPFSRLSDNQENQIFQSVKTKKPQPQEETENIITNDKKSDIFVIRNETKNFSWMNKTAGQATEVHNNSIFPFKTPVPYVAKRKIDMCKSFRKHDATTMILNENADKGCRISMRNVIDRINPSSTNKDEKGPTTPLEKAFGRAVEKAVLSFQSQNAANILSSQPDPAFQHGSPTAKKIGPLAGIRIASSKKLAKHQSEYNNITISLGGEYLWSFDDSCTHFLFQGKAHDMSKEYKTAVSKQKKVVSPHWLFACKETNSLVDDRLFPHTYNPNKVLEMVLTPASNKTARLREEKVKQSAQSTDSENELLLKLESALNNSSAKMHTSSLADDVLGSSSLITEKLRQRYEPQKSESVTSPWVKSAWVDEEAESAKAELLAQCTQFTQAISDVDAINCMMAAKDGSSACVEKINIVNNKPSLSDLSFNSKTNCENTNGMPAQTLCEDIAYLHETHHPSNKENVEMNGEKQVTENKIFQFTGIQKPEKIEYTSILVHLGASVTDMDHYDPNSTHLIAESPIRNEKFLAFIASCKWILHPSYINECKRSNMFLDEGMFEWGSEQRLTTITRPLAYKLALAARSWRLKSQKAFSGWMVLLHVQPSRVDKLVAMLEAGGAEVIVWNKEGDVPRGLTHAFIEPKLLSTTGSLLSELTARGIPALQFEYIASYLYEDPQPDIEHYLLIASQSKPVQKRTSSRRNEIPAKQIRLKQ